MKKLWFIIPLIFSLSVSPVLAYSSGELLTTPLFSSPELLAYWRLEDANSTVGSYTLSNNNSPTYTAGKFGNAATFVAASSQSLYNSSTNLDSTGPFTVNAWVNFNTLPTGTNDMDVVGERITSDSIAEIYEMFSNGSVSKDLQFQTWAASGGFLQLDSGVVPNTGQWYMVTGVHGSNTDWRFYVNGIDKASSTASRPISSSGGVGITIGAFDQGSAGVTGYMDGQVDDVSYMTRALNDTEVSNLYNNTFTKFKVGGKTNAK